MENITAAAREVAALAPAPYLDIAAVTAQMRASGRDNLIHYAGAAHRHMVAWHFCWAFVADPTARERDLKVDRPAMRLGHRGRPRAHRRDAGGVVVTAAATDTPGAGYGCSPGRCVPGKRLRNWHRSESKQQRPSLREFARALVAIAAGPNSTQLDRDRAVTAERWFGSKGVAIIRTGSVRQTWPPSVRS